MKKQSLYMNKQLLYIIIIFLETSDLNQLNCDLEALQLNKQALKELDGNLQEKLKLLKAALDKFINSNFRSIDHDKLDNQQISDKVYLQCIALQSINLKLRFMYTLLKTIDEFLRNKEAIDQQNNNTDQSLLESFFLMCEKFKTELEEIESERSPVTQELQQLRNSIGGAFTMKNEDDLRALLIKCLEGRKETEELEENNSTTVSYCSAYNTSTTPPVLA